MTIKHPNIFIDLSRIDGNAFSILGAVTREMRRQGLSTDEIEAYREEATSGDYDHLLATTMEWVNVDYIDDEEDPYDDFDDEDYDDLDEEEENRYN